MISKSVSDFWTAWAPALGNHLWQSTLFAAFAGLLTLLLRKNHAGVRYWLWLAASLKFLLPFSLLISLGNYLSPASNSGSSGDFFVAMETVSQPFPRSFPKTASTVAHIHVSFIANLVQLLPAILAFAWLIGFLAVLLTWFLRWRRISSAIRAAVPVHAGREVETLRKLEQIGGIRQRI
jgi:bla regulator protein BlaR1